MFLSLSFSPPPPFRICPKRSGMTKTRPTTWHSKPINTPPGKDSTALRGITPSTRYGTPLQMGPQGNKPWEVLGGKKSRATWISRTMTLQSAAPTMCSSTCAYWHGPEVDTALATIPHGDYYQRTALRSYTMAVSHFRDALTRAQTCQG